MKVGKTANLFLNILFFVKLCYTLKSKKSEWTKVVKNGVPTLYRYP